ncbi:DUF2239 family protein [Caulobacter endophyticus]|uniref:DUF2239 domain-containing protein n=1 Tax=Caulobacter endophyticus TaxID=2172652 RepID=A0A2T9KD05_9CAUL|nr:DUF2239 family protein [Caulobacter endophyticus]PVM93721.1 DUF2239 domain-containing protein [Caulobacter endophyticus]
MTYALFETGRRLAAGDKLAVALAAQAVVNQRPDAPILIFDPDGRQVDFDLRGSPEDLAARLAPPGTVAEPKAPRGRGRPKLGVVAREVTLLPRHWDWLAAQPGGASVALRKLVETARREAEAPDRQRRARDAAYRFASAAAGDAPGFEAAMRALYAGDREGFEAGLAQWPADVAAHARLLAEF